MADLIADDFASINQRMHQIELEERLGVVGLDAFNGYDLDHLARSNQIEREPGESDRSLRLRVAGTMMAKGLSPA